MRELLIFLGLCLLGVNTFYVIKIAQKGPQKIIITLPESQVKALEARVETLEEWAVKRGGRLQ